MSNHVPYTKKSSMIMPSVVSMWKIMCDWIWNPTSHTIGQHNAITSLWPLWDRVLSSVRPHPLPWYSSEYGSQMKLPEFYWRHSRRWWHRLGHEQLARCVIFQASELLTTVGLWSEPRCVLIQKYMEWILHLCSLGMFAIAITSYPIRTPSIMCKFIGAIEEWGFA